MNRFTIRDIENLSGIKAHTIRIWEQRYSFLKPRRTATNIRYYTGDDLRAILNISVLNKYGFKISHISRLTAADIMSKVAGLNSEEAMKDRIVNELIQKMVELDSRGFEQLVDKHIKAAGMEKAIIKILFPFFERIGVLWQTGNINPAQEHLISNIIRQKIITGIDQANPVLQSGKKALLFLPEDIHHEMGLLFVAYLLKRQGVETYYLGANIPLKDAHFVADIKKPDFIYMHLTSAPKGYSSHKFLQRLSSAFPKNKIMISGYLTSYTHSLPSNIRFIPSLSQAIAFITSL
jgi:MerR family transcriptional regulator, light-induced transcriptional regulator